MNKIITNKLQKHHFFNRLILGTLPAMLLITSALSAQTITLGEGTEVSSATSGSGLGPVNSFYTDMHYQVVYTAQEIIAAGGAAGVVSQFGFNVATPSDSVLPNYKVGLALTTAVNSETHNPNNVTTVYNGNFTSAEGFNMFVSTTSFLWDGTSNILVDICYSGAIYNEVFGQVYVYGTADNSSRFFAYDYEEVCGVATNTPNAFKPQARFVFSEVPECLQPRTVSVLGVTETTASLMWASPAEGIPVGYQYVVSEVNEIPADGGTFAGGLSAALTGLTPATTYYVFVRTVCNGDYSEWNTGTFTTAGAMDVSGVSKTSLAYYPNPVSDVLNLNNSSEIKSVAIFNLLGLQVAAQQPHAAIATINTSLLAQGTYLVKVATATGTSTLKVVKQ